MSDADTNNFDVSSVVDSLKGIVDYGKSPITATDWLLQYTYSFKPLYIMHKLLTLKGAVLWMDSDLEFEKVPELLATDPTRRPIDLGVVNNKPFWKHTIWDGYSMCVASVFDCTSLSTHPSLRFLLPGMLRLVSSSSTTRSRRSNLSRFVRKLRTLARVEDVT